MKEKLTQERLKELLHYDPETGVFIWNKSGFGFKKDKITNCLHKNSGYIVIRVNNKLYKAHRLAFLYMEGYLPENEVDHIDRNRSNNKWNNLREVSRSCNVRNSNVPKNNKSSIKGVYYDNNLKKYRSRIVIKNKSISLGCFISLLDAAKARWQAEVKYNFPNCNTTSSAYNYLKEHGDI